MCHRLTGGPLPTSELLLLLSQSTLLLTPAHLSLTPAGLQSTGACPGESSGRVSVSRLHLFLCPRQTGSPVRAGMFAAFPADARSLECPAWCRWWMNVCGMTALCERGLTNLSLEAGSYPAGKGAWVPPVHSWLIFCFFFFCKKKSEKDLSALEVGKIRIHVHCCKTEKFSSHFDCLINILCRILFAHKVFVLQKPILVIKTRICVL